MPFKFCKIVVIDHVYPSKINFHLSTERAFQAKEKSLLTSAPK